MNGKSLIASESVMDVIEDRLVQSTLIPYVRARKVFFKATGLRPDTQHFMFFDREPMAEFVKEESTFVRHADNPVDYGNTLFGKTTHPETKGDLVSDAKGEIIGSLLIPNSDTAKFKVGSREVMLLDVTAANPNNASSIARTIYTAKGTLETRTGTVASSRLLHLVGLEVEKRVVHGQHGDDGIDNIVTTYTVPAGTNFYYANDADATNKTTNGMYSNDAQTTITTFNDISAFNHGVVTVDPEIGINPIEDVYGHTNFSLTGGTSISNTSTNKWGDIPTKDNLDVYTHDYNNNNDDDNSGMDASSGVDNSGGGWT